MTNAAPTRDSKGSRARASPKRRRPRCRDCPFCAPSGQCLDRTIRSGRCGDWVFYVLRRNKQWRRRWVKPRDRCTPKQRYWRARLGAASRSYSASLTHEQQNACIAAGAKRRSRRRLGQSGRLTGQQYWVGKRCAAPAQAPAQSAERPTKGLQTKRIPRPTWDAHRSGTVAPPGQHRGVTRRARPERRKAEIPSPKCETNPKAQGPKAQNRSGARGSVNSQLVPWICSGCRASGFGFGKSSPGRAVRMRPRGFRPYGCAGRPQTAVVEAERRQQRAVVRRERGPP